MAARGVTRWSLTKVSDIIMKVTFTFMFTKPPYNGLVSGVKTQSAPGGFRASGEIHGGEPSRRRYLRRSRRVAPAMVSMNDPGSTRRPAG
jgi:hypothetical protein